MAMVWKAIKPKRLKIPGIRSSLRNASRRVGTKIRKDFKATVADWDHKPKFTILESSAKGMFTLVVGTDNLIYMFVNDGTKPHDIPKVPKTSGSLAFASGYSAKTAPNVIGSSPGGSYGPMVFAKQVHHPGTEPRNFSRIIQRKWEPRYKRALESALRKAVAESGHGGK